MANLLALSLVPGITLTEKSEGDAVLSTPRAGHLPLKGLTPSLLAAFRRLIATEVAEEELDEEIMQAEGLIALTRFHYYLRQIARLGVITHRVLSDGRVLATSIPISQDYGFNLRDSSPEQKYQFSRFALCRREGQMMLIESPLSPAQITLHDASLFYIVADLAMPKQISELAQARGELPEEVVRHIVKLLLNASFLTAIAEDGTAQEETTILRQWEFHDLLFHTRSRLGRHQNPFGGTYRFLDSIEPLPAIKPPTNRPTIELYRPDIDALKQADVPFTRALEERRSIRTYRDEPLTEKQLGEFLYRTARERRRMNDKYQELSSRPYPNGGSLCELELYPIINKCQGLPRGVFHYRPREHQLSLCAEPELNMEKLLHMASITGTAPDLQVLIIISARFQRAMWKYQSMAYALILKNVGVLFQTMYLVATAMGLAPCALGGGDSDLFSKLIGTDYFSETSVGEFILGSRIDEERESVS